MRTEQEIWKKIETLKSDERYQSPPATAVENAGLALIQQAIEAKLDAWRWVLETNNPETKP